MKVLITGVDGFLGMRLAGRLLAEGEEVAGLVLDRVTADSRSLASKVEIFEGDLLDPESLRRALRQAQPEAVVHLAGLSHVGKSWQALPEYFRVNVLGTESLVSAVSCPFLFASSSEVYGELPDAALPFLETAPLSPRSPYALTKAAAERLVIGSGAVVVRMFNLVGPGQSPDFALPSFARQLAEITRGERDPVLRVGNLEVRRDFVHVDDAAEAYVALLRAGKSGETYNLASGRATELREALNLLIEIAKVDVRVEIDPERARPIDTPIVYGDATKLRSLDWRPRRGLERALRDLWQSVSSS